MKTVLYMVIVLLHLAIFLAGFAMFEFGTRIFMGVEEFNSLQEAYEYQEVVITEAISVGAEVASAEISITSPPVFKYKIILPAKDDGILDSLRLFGEVKNHQFKYGIQSISVGGVWAGVIIIGVVIIAFIWLYTYVFFIFCKKQSSKQMMW